MGIIVSNSEGYYEGKMGESPCGVLKTMGEWVNKC